MAQPTEPAEPPQQAAHAEEISFIGFVISLASTAAVHFGDVDNPVAGGRTKPDLVAARQMIDVLSMLEQVLYELRMRFVQVATEQQKPQP